MHPFVKNFAFFFVISTQCHSLWALDDAQPSQASVYLAQQMYVAYYGRPGDSAGVTYWAGRFDDSDNLEDVLAAFGNSTEFTDNYGNLSKEKLVNGLFLQMFNRDSDDQGLDFYIKRLQSGQATLASIAKQIADGAIVFDLATINNKVAVSNEYTDYVAAGEISYSNSEIDSVSGLLATVNYSEATKNTFLEKIDFWASTGYQNVDLYCEAILQEVFRDNLDDGTYELQFNNALAYENQSSWCQAALAYMYQDGRGVSVNTNKSLEYAQASAAQNNPAGQTILGEKYFVGNGLAIDPDASVNLFSSATAEYFWRSFYGLGRYYLQPDVLDEDLAFQYFQRAHTTSIDHQYKDGKPLGALAYSHFKGQGVPSDSLQAVNLAEAGMLVGDNYSTYLLGQFYLTGSGVPQSYEDALFYFEMGDGQNDKNSSFELGKMYHSSLGVSVDYPLALYYFERAIDPYRHSVGLNKAKGYIGEMHYFGKGVPQSYEEAFNWWLEGAIDGDGWSQQWLGYLYETGTYTSKNINQAIHWYQLAANQGVENAREKADALRAMIDADMRDIDVTETGENGFDQGQATEPPPLIGSVLAPDSIPGPDSPPLPDVIPPTGDTSPLDTSTADTTLPGTTIPGTTTPDTTAPDTSTSADHSPNDGADSPTESTKTLSISWNRPLTRVNGDSLAPHEITSYTLYYYQPGEIQVQVSIDAYQANGNPQLNYTTGDLPAGTYFFSIDCVDRNGLHSEASALVRVIVD